MPAPLSSASFIHSHSVLCCGYYFCPDVFLQISGSQPEGHSSSNGPRSIETVTIRPGSQGQIKKYVSHPCPSTLYVSERGDWTQLDHAVSMLSYVETLDIY